MPRGNCRSAVSARAVTAAAGRRSGIIPAMVALGLGLLYAAARPSSRLFRVTEMAWPGGQLERQIGVALGGFLWTALAVYLVLHG